MTFSEPLNSECHLGSISTMHIYFFFWFKEWIISQIDTQTWIPKGGAGSLHKLSETFLIYKNFWGVSNGIKNNGMFQGTMETNSLISSLPDQIQVCIYPTYDADVCKNEIARDGKMEVLSYHHRQPLSAMYFSSVYTYYQISSIRL